jgi:hypothetical protein
VTPKLTDSLQEIESKPEADVAQLVEQPIRNGQPTSRVRFFSTLCGTCGSLKRHKTGAFGSVLGKEMGKEFVRGVFPE